MQHRTRQSGIIQGDEWVEVQLKALIKGPTWRPRFQNKRGGENAPPHQRKECEVRGPEREEHWNQWVWVVPPNVAKTKPRKEMLESTSNRFAGRWREKQTDGRGGGKEPEIQAIRKKEYSWGFKPAGSRETQTLSRFKPPKKKKKTNKKHLPASVAAGKYIGGKHATDPNKGAIGESGRSG